MMTKTQIEEKLRMLRPDWPESKIQQGVKELYYRQQQRRLALNSQTIGDAYPDIDNSILMRSQKMDALR